VVSPYLAAANSRWCGHPDYTFFFAVKQPGAQPSHGAVTGNLQAVSVLFPAFGLLLKVDDFVCSCVRACGIPGGVWTSYILS
jgi:hypothetical protein